MKHIPDNINDLLAERIGFAETIIVSNNSLENYYTLLNFKYLQKIANNPDDTHLFIRGVKNILHKIISTALEQISDNSHTTLFELYDYNENLIYTMMKIWKDVTGEQYWGVCR